jgi:hypothetical protein
LIGIRGSGSRPRYSLLEALAESAHRLYEPLGRLGVKESDRRHCLLRASGLSRAMISNAWSMSSGSRTPNGRIAIPSVRAAASDI